MLIPNSSKKWILIIEDEKDLKDMLSEELAREGFKTLSSGRVLEASRLLNNQKFSCILLDMRLEAGTGSQVISAIRKDKHGVNFRTPILIISGQLDAELVRELRDSVSGVFVKPFNMSALLSKIKHLCAHED